MTHIKRLGRKQKKTVSLSHDVVDVMDELYGHREFSHELEIALWEHLIEKHGRMEIYRLLEKVHNEMGEEARMLEAKHYDLTA